MPPLRCSSQTPESPQIDTSRRSRLCTFWENMWNRISALLNVILPVGRGVGQLILMQFLVGCVTFPANRYLDIIYTNSDIDQLKILNFELGMTVSRYLKLISKSDHISWSWLVEKPVFPSQLQEEYMF